jgi:hypothetical protein
VSDQNGLGDFDFFVGSWHSIQRKLKKPLADCDEWDESSATTRCWQVFGGAANIDEVHFPEWSIYWVNSRNGELALPPVTGRFSDGVGVFYDEEKYEGRDITVRYKWSDITATTARWEQAFSLDGGQTWETNWTANFTRTG